MKTENDIPTLKEFKKDVVIYKSHKLANGFISITYAYRVDANTVTTQSTKVAEDHGGAWKSLYKDLVYGPDTNVDPTIFN